MNSPASQPTDSDNPELADSQSPVAEDTPADSPDGHVGTDSDEQIQNFVDGEDGDEVLLEDAQMLTPTVSAPRSDELYAASLANACAAGKIADELRGKNIVLLDMTGLTSIVDFFVVVTAASQRQMHAIADEVNRKLKREDGNQRISVEGYRTQGNWLLTDYGDVVLHVFTPEGRALYALEKLWSDAGRINWQTGEPGNAPDSSGEFQHLIDTQYEFADMDSDQYESDDIDSDDDIDSQIENDDDLNGDDSDDVTDAT